jgi:hypothetical protein
VRSTPPIFCQYVNTLYKEMRATAGLKYSGVALSHSNQSLSIRERAGFSSEPHSPACRRPIEWGAPLRAVSTIHP